MHWVVLIPTTLLGLFLSLPNGASRARPGDGQPNLEPTLENIDPRIYPLIVAMNATGVCKTLASCEGHWESMFYISQPYVAFHSDIHFAQCLSARVLTLTNLPWYVREHCGFNQKLYYRLAVSMEELSLFQKVPLLFRKDFDHDIQNIVKLVEVYANNKRH